MEDDALDPLTPNQAIVLNNFIGEHWAKFMAAAKEAGESADMIAQKLDFLVDGD